MGLVAISYDPVNVLRFFADRKSIRFPLLSDEDSSVIRVFGLLNESVPKNTEFFGVPHPATYIVDQNGVVQSRTLEEDYRRRFTVGNLLGRKASASEVKARRLRIVQSSSDSLVHGGQIFKLRLELDLPKGSHVYSPGVQGYIPIDWKIEPSEQYQMLPMRYPEFRMLHLKAIDETVPVYEGKVVLERDIVPAQKVAGDTIRIVGSLRYQVCDEKQCYLPETVPLEWTVRYEGHDSTRAPLEIRRKRR